MTYDEAILQKAGDFAQLLMTDAELADILGLNVSRIRLSLRDPDDLLGQAIRTGRATTKAGLHKSLIDLAIRGSSPAQAAVTNLLKTVGA